MELGAEISKKIKKTIKRQLKTLGSYVDDELPEYIMVMIANKRSEDQMVEDLNLFLGDETEKFVNWLFGILTRLQRAMEYDAILENQVDSKSEQEEGMDIEKEKRKSQAKKKSKKKKEKRMSSDSDDDASSRNGRRKRLKHGESLVADENLLDSSRKKRIQSDQEESDVSQGDRGDGSADKKDGKRKSEFPAKPEGRRGEERDLSKSEANVDDNRTRHRVLDIEYEDGIKNDKRKDDDKQNEGSKPREDNKRKEVDKRNESDSREEKEKRKEYDKRNESEKRNKSDRRKENENQKEYDKRNESEKRKEDDQRNESEKRKEDDKRSESDRRKENEKRKDADKREKDDKRKEEEKRKEERRKEERAGRDSDERPDRGQLKQKERDSDQRSKPSRSNKHDNTSAALDKESEKQKISGKDSKGSSSGQSKDKARAERDDEDRDAKREMSDLRVLIDGAKRPEPNEEERHKEWVQQNIASESTKDQWKENQWKDMMTVSSTTAPGAKAMDAVKLIAADINKQLLSEPDKPDIERALATAKEDVSNSLPAAREKAEERVRPASATAEDSRGKSSEPDAAERSKRTRPKENEALKAVSQYEDADSSSRTQERSARRRSTDKAARKGRIDRTVSKDRTRGRPDDRQRRSKDRSGQRSSVGNSGSLNARSRAKSRSRSVGRPRSRSKDRLPRSRQESARAEHSQRRHEDRKSDLSRQSKQANKEKEHIATNAKVSKSTSGESQPLLPPPNEDQSINEDTADKAKLALQSKVQVYTDFTRRPTLSPSRQASSALLKKAVSDVTHSSTKGEPREDVEEETLLSKMFDPDKPISREEFEHFRLMLLAHQAQRRGETTSEMAKRRGTLLMRDSIGADSGKSEHGTAEDGTAEEGEEELDYEEDLVDSSHKPAMDFASYLEGISEKDLEALFSTKSGDRRVVAVDSNRITVNVQCDQDQVDDTLRDQVSDDDVTALREKVKQSILNRLGARGSIQDEGQLGDDSGLQAAIAASESDEEIELRKQLLKDMSKVDARYAILKFRFDQEIQRKEKSRMRMLQEHQLLREVESGKDVTRAGRQAKAGEQKFVGRMVADIEEKAKRDVRERDRRERMSWRERLEVLERGHQRSRVSSDRTSKVPPRERPSRASDAVAEKARAIGRPQSKSLKWYNDGRSLSQKSSGGSSDDEAGTSSSVQQRFEERRRVELHELRRANVPAQHDLLVPAGDDPLESKQESSEDEDSLARRLRAKIKEEKHKKLFGILTDEEHLRLKQERETLRNELEVRRRRRAAEPTTGAGERRDKLASWNPSAEARISHFGHAAGDGKATVKAGDSKRHADSQDWIEKSLADDPSTRQLDEDEWDERAVDVPVVEKQTYGPNIGSDRASSKDDVAEMEVSEDTLKRSMHGDQQRSSREPSSTLPCMENTGQSVEEKRSADRTRSARRSPGSRRMKQQFIVTLDGLEGTSKSQAMQARAQSQSDTDKAQKGRERQSTRKRQSTGNLAEEKLGKQGRQSEARRFSRSSLTDEEFDAFLRKREEDEQQRVGKSKTLAKPSVALRSRKSRLEKSEEPVAEKQSQVCVDVSSQVDPSARSEAPGTGNSLDSSNNLTAPLDTSGEVSAADEEIMEAEKRLLAQKLARRSTEKVYDDAHHRVASDRVDAAPAEKHKRAFINPHFKRALNQPVAAVRPMTHVVAPLQIVPHVGLPVIPPGYQPSPMALAIDGNHVSSLTNRVLLGSHLPGSLVGDSSLLTLPANVVVGDVTAIVPRLPSVESASHAPVVASVSTSTASKGDDLVAASIAASSPTLTQQSGTSAAIQSAPIARSAPAKVNQRCLFWPQCKNESACPYTHPTVSCSLFPNCTFASRCLFIHPLCKFDGRCANANCLFTHTTEHPTVGVGACHYAPSGSSLSSQLCKFIPNCANANCPYKHPIFKPCHFGSACQNPDCLFIHETRPADKQALKWHAPKSERRYGPDDGVESAVATDQ